MLSRRKKSVDWGVFCFALFFFFTSARDIKDDCEKSCNLNLITTCLLNVISYKKNAMLILPKYVRLCIWRFLRRSVEGQKIRSNISVALKVNLILKIISTIFSSFSLLSWFVFLALNPKILKTLYKYVLRTARKLRRSQKGIWWLKYEDREHERSREGRAKVEGVKCRAARCRDFPHGFKSDPSSKQENPETSSEVWDYIPDRF